jgi:hypothetical protein
VDVNVDQGLLGSKRYSVYVDFDNYRYRIVDSVKGKVVKRFKVDEMSIW